MTAFHLARELGGLRRRVGHEHVHERGFADARLADEERRAFLEGGTQCGEACAVARRHLDARQAEHAVVGELRREIIAPQVRLVEDQQRLDVLQARARPIAVDDEPVGERLAGGDHGDAVQVGGDRLGASAGIDALEEIAARLERLDGRSAAVGFAAHPVDSIAAYDALLAAPQRAAQSLAARLHERAAAVAREHDADAAPAAQLRASATMR